MLERPLSERVEIQELLAGPQRVAYVYLDRCFHGQVFASGEGFRASLHWVDLGYFAGWEEATIAVRTWYGGLDIEPW